jgi:hypothetical protein
MRRKVKHPHFFIDHGDHGLKWGIFLWEDGMKRTMMVLAAAVFVFSLSAPSVMAQPVDYCEGNFDNDLDQDGTDAFVFKSDFGRSGIVDPCPPDGPAPVPKTGQTLCYDTDGNPRDCAGTGEDGEYQKGVALPDPRFIDNGDGTVTDKLTGLIWLKNANCFSARTWEQALANCSALADGACGLTDASIPGDWRLPHYKELFSLVDPVNHSPALPSGHPFTDVQDTNYWSSTTYSSQTSVAWLLNMNLGSVSYTFKTSYIFVWPVRGGR